LLGSTIGPDVTEPQISRLNPGASCGGVPASASGGTVVTNVVQYRTGWPAKSSGALSRMKSSSLGRSVAGGVRPTSPGSAAGKVDWFTRVTGMRPGSSRFIVATPPFGMICMMWPW
jgi:hypothetical protein